MKSLHVVRVAHPPVAPEGGSWIVDELWAEQAVGFIGGISGASLWRTVWTPATCATSPPDRSERGAVANRAAGSAPASAALPVWRDRGGLPLPAAR